MLEDKQVLIRELAYILYKRNQIEIRRRRAKSKIGYYENLKQTVNSYKALTKEVATLTRGIRLLSEGLSAAADLADVVGDAHAKLEFKKKELDEYKHYKNKPFKWLNNASGLNKLILKYRAEYMKARYDAARLTCESRKRVARLTKLLSANIGYQAGTAFVEALYLFNRTEGVMHDEFEAMYKEVEANKAVERMLRSK